MKLFRKRPYIPIEPLPKYNSEKKPIVPEGLWEKCPQCNRTIYTKELGDGKYCPHCHYSFRIGSRERIDMITDAESFAAFDEDMPLADPLEFPGYQKKMEILQKKTGLGEAVTTGIATVMNQPLVIGVMDAGFIMGSMGKVVGEKITRAFEYATAHRLPVVLFTASGGARMQEGIISLMQMAKVSTAVSDHHKNGLFYLSVLTDPTTGGVTASFAMQADIILAEPGATVGFAGKRVIEQTIKAELPENFQTAEDTLDHGFIDRIVPREELRRTLAFLLAVHGSENQRRSLREKSE